MKDKRLFKTVISQFRHRLNLYDTLIILNLMGSPLFGIKCYYVKIKPVAKRVTYALRISKFINNSLTFCTSIDYFVFEF
jgi:hypothetical protein